MLVQCLKLNFALIFDLTGSTIKLGFDARNLSLVFAINTACASAQTDQRLCYSLLWGGAGVPSLNIFSS